MICKPQFVTLLVGASCLFLSSAEKAVDESNRNLQIGGGGIGVGAGGSTGSGIGIGNGNDDASTGSLSGPVTVAFEAKWQLGLDLENCRGDFATKTITCTNGEIELLGGLYPNVNCTVTGDDIMECIDDSAEFFVNDFSGVRFTCTAEDAVPTVVVEFASVDSFCASEEADTVSHYLQLGMDCGNETVFSADRIECADDNTNSLEDGRPTCAAVARSASSELLPTGVAQISTNEAWSSGEFESCFAGGGLALNAPAPASTSSSETELQSSPTTTASPPAASPTPPSTVEESSTSTSETEPTDTTSPPAASPTPPPTIEETFEAVAGTTYSTQYQFRFKRAIDEGCEGPSKDVFGVYCPQGKLELIKVGDGAACLDPKPSTNGDGEIALCETTCREDACDDVYIDRNSRFVLGTYIMEDNYIEIEYTCSALDDVNGVDSTAVVLGTETTEEEGRCVGEAGGATSTSGKNLVLGELNVMCETEDGPEYVNEDAYTECDFASDWAINDRYNCFSGRSCRTDSCLVPYKDLNLIADHHRFPQKCIKTDNGSKAPPAEALDLSNLEPFPAGQYTATFQLGSGFWYDDVTCSGRKTGIRIECIDGTITLGESNSDKKCSVVSDSVVECIEDEFSVVNEHVDVAIYDCTATDGVPQTRAEYYSTDIECDSAATERGSRWLNLGALCGDPGSQSFFSYDYFFECGADNYYGTTTDDIRFSCSSRFEVPRNSPGVVVPIDKVDIMTDYRWQYDSSDRCYSYKASTSSVERMYGLTKNMVKDGLTKLAGGERRLLSEETSGAHLRGGV